MTFAIFHDFPGLENGLSKFHDFPWPGDTLDRPPVHRNRTTFELLVAFCKIKSLAIHFSGQYIAVGSKRPLWPGTSPHSTLPGEVKARQAIGVIGINISLLETTSFKSHETWMLSGGICFGLCSKDDLNLALKTTLCVGFCWFEPSFRTYCRQSLVRLSSNDGSFAATHRLVAGDVLKAPRHKRSAWFWIGSSIRRYDLRAEPYTTQP